MPLVLHGQIPSCARRSVFLAVALLQYKLPHTLAIHAVRVWKKADTSDKARLLKITVETETEKASILCNVFKLQNKELSEDLRKIFITPDITPKEKEEHKVLRAIKVI